MLVKEFDRICERRQLGVNAGKSKVRNVGRGMSLTMLKFRLMLRGAMSVEMLQRGAESVSWCENEIRRKTKNLRCIEEDV